MRSNENEWVAHRAMLRCAAFGHESGAAIAVTRTQLQRKHDQALFGDNAMRHPHFIPITIVATAFMIIDALAPFSARAQAPARPQPPVQAPAAVKHGPYKPVAVKLPTLVRDASFDAFRTQLAGVAKKKDRAALARIVAPNFFWIADDDADVADKKKPAIDNLAKALGLEGSDAPGWELVANFAAETSAAPDAQRPGVICAPALPSFDEQAAEDLAAETLTDLAEWVYPVRDGLEVRSAPQPRGQVVEKLGLHLVRLLDEDPPASNSFLKVLTPSGKAGYVPADTVRDLVEPQMCFIKDVSGWKIAGYFGGDAHNDN
jgi:hypothetical protein